jgi:hypothetical protein
MSMNIDYLSSSSIFWRKTLWKKVTGKTKVLIINLKKFRYGESDWIQLALGEGQ